jgi:hypothetical protein
MTAQLSSVTHNRHSIIPLHIWSSPCLIYLLVCLVVLPGARAVTPAPDGGYPNNNTAEGDFALQLLTGGTDNTAVGTSALYSNLSGSNNIAIGVDALVSNTEGNYNTAVTSRFLAIRLIITRLWVHWRFTATRPGPPTPPLALHRFPATSTASPIPPSAGLLSTVASTPAITPLSEQTRC